MAPLFFDIAEAMKGGSMMQWRGQAGTQIALIPRDGAASPSSRAGGRSSAPSPG